MLRNGASARRTMATMKAAFVLVRCEMGKIEEVANSIMEIEGVSEVH